MVSGNYSLIEVNNISLIINLFILNNLLGNGDTICFSSNDFLLIIIASTTVAGTIVYFAYFQSFIEEYLYRILFKLVVAESIVAVLSYIAYFLERFPRFILFLVSLVLIGFILYYVADYVNKYRSVLRGLIVAAPSSYFRATSLLISLLITTQTVLNWNDYFLCLTMLLLGIYIIASSIRPEIIICSYYLIIWITPVVFLYVFCKIMIGETDETLLLFIPAFLSISILSRTFYYTTYHYSSLKTLVSRPIVVIDVEKFKPHRMYNILSMTLSNFKDYNKAVFISGYAPVFMPIVLEVMSKTSFSNKMSVYVTRVQSVPFFKFRSKKYVIRKFRINETILPEDKSQIFTSINFLVRAEEKTLVFIDDLVEVVNILGSELVYNMIKSILQKSDYGEKVTFIVFVRTGLMDLFKKGVKELYNEIKSIATTVLKV